MIIIQYLYLSKDSLVSGDVNEICCLLFDQIGHIGFQLHVLGDKFSKESFVERLVKAFGDWRINKNQTSQGNIFQVDLAQIFQCWHAVYELTNALGGRPFDATGSGGIPIFSTGLSTLKQPIHVLTVVKQMEQFECFFNFSQ